MALRIERAGPDDAPGLTDCINSAYGGYRSQGIDLPPVAEGVADDIEHHHVLVAWDDGVIIGGLILSIDPPEAYLKNIAVHAEHDKRGIGRSLLDAASSTAIKAGCTVMKLTTHSGIPANVALYRHLGWRVSATEGIKVAMERDLAR